MHLICVGNPLHGDDGFGAALYHHLARLDWPLGVRVFDATRDSALPMFEQCAHALVLDVLPPNFGAPGEIIRLNDAAYPPSAMGMLSGGTATLLAAVRRIVVPAPMVEILGPVATRRVPFSPGLSPLVAAAVETVTAMLVREYGARARRGAA